MELKPIEDTRIINESISEVKITDWLKSGDTEGIINNDYTMNALMVIMLFNLEPLLENVDEMLEAFKKANNPAVKNILIDCNNNTRLCKSVWMLPRLHFSTLENNSPVKISYAGMSLYDVEGVMCKRIYPIDIIDGKLALKK